MFSTKPSYYNVLSSDLLSKGSKVLKHTDFFKPLLVLIIFHGGQSYPRLSV